MMKKKQNKKPCKRTKPKMKSKQERLSNMALNMSPCSSRNLAASIVGMAVGNTVAEFLKQKDKGPQAIINLCDNIKGMLEECIVAKDDGVEE